MMWKTVHISFLICGVIISMNSVSRLDLFIGINMSILSIIGLYLQ